MKYAYLGPAGTFTEGALRLLPTAAAAFAEPFATIPAALAAVRSGECLGAVVPLENSVASWPYVQLYGPSVRVPVTWSHFQSGAPSPGLAAGLAED